MSGAASGLRHAWLVTPIGRLTLVESGRGLRAIHFEAEAEGLDAAAIGPRVARLTCDAIEQLDAYFAGERSAFELPLDAVGTPFQQAVWDAVARIPYGATRSYAEVAEELGRPGAARAVGAANGRNPLPIVVPCHRVLGRDGTLTGYAGGLAIKRALLELEHGHASPQPPLFGAAP